MQIIESMPEIRNSISQVSQKFARKWLLVVLYNFSVKHINFAERKK